MTATQPSLHVHTAWSAEHAVQQLATALSQPEGDPFAEQLVAVEVPGVQRWLQQQLALVLGADGADDGICAGIQMPTMRGLIIQALATVDETSVSAWRSSAVQWALVSVFNQCWDHDWFAPLRAYLKQPGERPGRRADLARRLAIIMTGYQFWRPDVLQEWTNGSNDAPPDVAWQPPLWRELCTHIGVPHLAALKDDVVAHLTADPHLLSWPTQVHVWRPEAIDPLSMELLRAASQHRDIHVWWPQYASVDHALCRESRSQLAALQAPSPADSPDLPETVLGQLQRDLLTGTWSPCAPDATVAFHSSHGRQRQVEVLRDAILATLAEHPQLQPRDVVIVCPAVESWAPLVRSAFGPTPPLTAGHHPAREIAVRIADPTLREVNPVLDVVRRVLDMCRGRATPAQLLELCACSAVAQRFGFDDDEIERIAVLVRESGMRWGMDPDHRTQRGYDTIPHYTWRSGLDRLLTGIVLPSTVTLPLISPMAEVSSSDTSIIGRLATVIEILTEARRNCTTPQPVAQWITWSRDLITKLTATPSHDEWQTDHAWATLAQLADDNPNSGPVLTAADFAASLTDAFRGRPPRSAFGSGAITMCSPDMVRGIPHGVVCLLGFDDEYPHVSGDDLVQRRPHVGDPDPRARQRQLLFDAVCSARERLIVVWPGHDPRAGTPLAMPVPLADVARRAEAICGTTPVIQHGLQPHSVIEFDAHDPHSFDQRALVAAQRSVEPKIPLPQRWRLDVDAPVDLPVVELARVMSFHSHPVREHLRHLGLPVWQEEVDPDADNVPAELNFLAKWQLRRRIQAGVQRGLDLDHLVQAEWSRGTLPPGDLGRGTIQQARAMVARVMDHAAKLLAPPVEQLCVDIDLDGTQLSGAVAVHGDHVVVLSDRAYPKAAEIMSLWIQLLAAASTGADVVGTVVGSNRRVRLSAPEADEALSRLADLVMVMKLGLANPLPLHPDIASSWSQSEQRAKQDWRYRSDKTTWDRFFPTLTSMVNHPVFQELALLLWPPVNERVRWMS